jgi:hypothetical protein
MKKTVPAYSDFRDNFSALPPQRFGNSVACSRCAAPMRQSELQFPFHTMVSRLGAPARPPRVLPTWCCTHCGLQQPRIEP